MSSTRWPVAPGCSIRSPPTWWRSCRTAPWQAPPGARLGLEVRSPAAAVVHPDAFVRCEPVADDLTVVADPVLLVEVLSKRTPEHDMYGQQLAFYAIPSLHHLLLTEPGTVAVRRESRQPDGTWLLRLFRELDSTVEIGAPRLSLPLRATCAGTALAGRARAAVGLPGVSHPVNVTNS